MNRKDLLASHLEEYISGVPADGLRSVVLVSALMRRSHVDIEYARDSCVAALNWAIF